MARRRKVKKGRLVLVIVLFIAVIISLAFLIFFILFKPEEKKEFNVEDLKINEIDYSMATTFDFDVNAKEYLLMRLNDFKVLYVNKSSEAIYPASLTKVLTMDTILDMCDDLNEKTSFTNEQRDRLIEENASLSYIEADTEYSVEDTLYALVLPSGADAAVALENYANTKGKDLVDEMNNKCNELSLKSSHFTNTTGLHDDNLYTSLDDYAEIVIDSVLKKEGLEILSTPERTIEGGIHLKSTLRSLCDRNDNIYVRGGKTGYTPEAGTSLMVLYEVNNRSYLLILANAPGNPYVDGYKSIEDAERIFNYLYK